MGRYEVPDGWVAQAYRFALDPTPAQQRALASHAGAARKAFNHMLGHVQAVMNQRAAERSYAITEADLTPAQGWSLAALRRTWNQHKHEVAPWWADNSKEAYNTGLDSLARALDNWAKSRTGERAGPPVGFPKFKKRHKAKASIRFTTGTIRVEPDRHHLTLPRVGRLKTHENTRKLARRVEAGTARVLSATVTCNRAGRWQCAVQVIVQHKQRPDHAVRSAHEAVGVDVGVRDLLVVATPDGTEVARVPAMKSLSQAQVRLRALQRRAARQRGPYDPQAKAKRRPSARWRRTQHRIARTHARAANIRRDALHKTTTALAQQHHVICVETLHATGMRRFGGARKRGLNRALADAALAEIRRMLAYKTRWYGSALVEADRWYPSSKTCSACGGRKPSLTLADRAFECEHCGVVLDRDVNAAINLARLHEIRTGERSPADSGSVAGREATRETEPARAGDAGGREASTPHSVTDAGQTGTALPQGKAA